MYMLLVMYIHAPSNYKVKEMFMLAFLIRFSSFSNMYHCLYNPFGDNISVFQNCWNCWDLVSLLNF